MHSYNFVFYSSTGDGVLTSKRRSLSKLRSYLNNQQPNQKKKIVSSFLFFGRILLFTPLCYFVFVNPQRLFHECPVWYKVQKQQQKNCISKSSHENQSILFLYFATTTTYHHHHTDFPPFFFFYIAISLLVSHLVCFANESAAFLTSTHITIH